MVSQYSVISDPFTAPTNPAANKQSSPKQDASASSFESHLRNQDRREASRQREDRQAFERNERAQDARAQNDRAHYERAEARRESADEAARAAAQDSRSDNRADKRSSARPDDRASTEAPARDTRTANRRADAPDQPRSEANESRKPDATPSATDQSQPRATAQTEETLASNDKPGTDAVGKEQTEGSQPNLALAAQPADAQTPNAPNTGQSADSLSLAMNDAAGANMAASEQAGTGATGQQSAVANAAQPASQDAGQTSGPSTAQTVTQNAALDAPLSPSQNATETAAQNGVQNAAPTPAINAATTPQVASSQVSEGQAPSGLADAPTVDSQPQQPTIEGSSAKAAELVATTTASAAPATQQASTQTAGQQPATEQVDTKGEANIQAQPVLDANGQQVNPTPIDAAQTELAQAPLSDDVAEPVSQSVSSHQAQPVTGETVSIDTVQSQPQTETGEASPDQSADSQAKIVTADRQDGQQQTPSSAQPQSAQQDGPVSDRSDQVASTTKQSATPEAQQSQSQAALNAMAQGRKGAEQVTNDPQQTTASDDTANLDADAGDEPARPKAVNPLTVASVESGTLRQAPKADAFTKMMAGIDHQAGLKDMAMQSDPTLKVDGMTPMQGDGSTVRLTGMESFARTGHVPQQAAAANAQAMAAQISKFAQRGETRFEIRLDPADLGKVDVRLTIGSDGQTRAHLFVERPETLDMFMRDQRMMERSLLQSGLNLDKQGLEFSLMDQQDSGQQMAHDQQQAMAQDNFGSSTKSDGFAEEQAIPSLAQPTHSGNYVASTGVNLVI